MADITIGAIGAAIIAGLISILSLVLGKEQKISEFRQAWIDELRKALVSYISGINAVADEVRTQIDKGKVDYSTLLPHYKPLNDATTNIKLRVNDEEEPAKALLASMEEFEKLASRNSDLTPDNIKRVEKTFLEASNTLLKCEWKRVKRGEKTFIVTKWSLIGMVLFLVVASGLGWFKTAQDPAPKNPMLHFLDL